MIYISEGKPLEYDGLGNEFRVGDKLKIIYGYGVYRNNQPGVFFYVKDETGLENPDDDWAISISHVDEVTKKLKKLSTAVGDGKKEHQENMLHPDDDNITKKTI